MSFEQLPEKIPKVQSEESTGGISLEEKAEAIRAYIDAGVIRERRRLTFEPDEEKVAGEKEFLLRSGASQLEKTLGQEEFSLIYEVVSEYNRLLSQMADNGLDEKELWAFEAEKGTRMLPDIVSRGVSVLERISDDLDYFFSLSERRGERMILVLKSGLNLLAEANKEWLESQKFGRDKEEKPMEIKGFEGFDQPDLTGEGFLRIAMEILPSGPLSSNVRTIEYDGKHVQTDMSQYGFTGTAAATFNAPNMVDGEITFHKRTASGLAESKWEFLESLPYILGHEWGHSLDPRLIDQGGFSPGEQFRMISGWEMVRAEEEEWSSYVKKIKKPGDRNQEELLKSQESLAESVAMFLTNPFVYEELCPKRYEFLTSLIKKRFPDFDLKRSIIAKELYDSCLSGDLPEGEVGRMIVDNFLKRAEK